MPRICTIEVSALLLNLISPETPAETSNLQQQPAVGNLHGVDTTIIQLLKHFGSL